MAIKHHNQEYDGGSPNLPLALGDRYYSQDLGRDFHYLRNLVGKILADMGQTLPALVSGGVVTKGAGDTLNITPAVGYAKHEVDLPDAFSVIPPAVIQEDIILRAESTQQTNMAVSGATLDGSTVNYVKLRYAEVDGDSRARAKKAGSYYYEQSAGFSIIVNPTANTAYDVLLATFTGTPGGAFTITQANPTLNLKGYMIDWGAGADEADGDLMPLGQAITHAPTGGAAAGLTATSTVRYAVQRILNLLIDLSGVANSSVLTRHYLNASITTEKLHQVVRNAFKGLNELTSERESIAKTGRNDDLYGKKLAGSVEADGAILNAPAFASPDEDMFEFTVGGYTLAGSNVMHGYVYVRDDSGSPAFYMSILPPTWDAAKNGWYSSGNPTHRCVYHFSHINTGSITVYLRSKMAGQDGLVKKMQKLSTWDMDADPSVSLVVEGSPDGFTPLGGMINHDDIDAVKHMIPFGSTDFELWIYTEDTDFEWSEVTIERLGAGTFDTTDYNSTFKNRGFLAYLTKQMPVLLSIETGANKVWFTAADWVEGHTPSQNSAEIAHIPADMAHEVYIQFNSTNYGFRQDGGILDSGGVTMDTYAGGWIKTGGTIKGGTPPIIRLRGSLAAITIPRFVPLWSDSDMEDATVQVDLEFGTKNCILVPATCTFGKLLTVATSSEGFFRVAKGATLTFDLAGVNSMYGNSGTGQLTVQINGEIICKGDIAGVSTYGLTIVCDGNQGAGELRVRADVTLVASAHTTIDTVNGGVWIFDGATGSGDPQLITSAANTEDPDVHLQVNNTWVEMQDDWSVNDFTLDAGTTLDKNGHTLTVNGSLVNNGTIIP